LLVRVVFLFQLVLVVMIWLVAPWVRVAVLLPAVAECRWAVVLVEWVAQWVPLPAVAECRWAVVLVEWVRANPPAIIPPCLPALV